MIEEITLEEVELRPGKFCDVFLQVNLELVDCECTSHCGDGMVTERWQEVEIQDLQVNLELVDCECTSPCGDGIATERWQEVEIHDVHVESVMYWTDSDTGVEIPLAALDEQDLKRIDELAAEKIERSLP